MNYEYWFGATLTFVCPHCQQMHTEKMGLNSPTDDQDKIKEKVNSQTLSCHRYKTALPDGVSVVVDVIPGTRESLIEQGFPFPLDK